MLRHLAGLGAMFEQSKRVAIAALTIALLMWLVGWGVVPNVAIKNMEWRRCCLPHVHDHRNCLTAVSTTRNRNAALTLGRQWTQVWQSAEGVIQKIGGW